MLKLLLRAIVAATIASALMITLGFLGSLHPAFDTLSHLRMHLGVCLMIAFAVLLWTHYRKSTLVALATGALALFSSLPGLPFSAKPLQADDTKPVYSLLHINLLWNHSTPAEAIKEIIAHDTDLISFAEASQVWAPHLALLGPAYPHVYSCFESGKRGGVRIYSKWPMTSDDNYCGTFGVFAKTTVAPPTGNPIEVGSLHLRWPWPASGPRQMDAILPAVRELGPDVLIAGDFNATTWSYAIKRFAQAGGLEFVTGIGPTWIFSELGTRITRWAGLPIDNIAAKGKVRILSAERTDSIGSDHLPILVRFQVE